MKQKFLFYAWFAQLLVEGIISFFATINILGEIKNASMSGNSINRLIILLFIILFLLCFIALFSFRTKLKKFLESHFNSDKSNKMSTALGLISIFLLWVTLFTPTVYLYQYESIFVKCKPFVIWLELILFQTILWINISKNNLSSRYKLSKIDKNLFLYTFIPLFLLWVFISITKIGLVKETGYWNVPGIPLTMIQFLGLLLFLGLGLILNPQNGNAPNSSTRILTILIPVGIYLTAVLLWGFTPMLKHFFSLQPTLPNLQPFPYSDARVHDLGALSIVMGKGIYFHGFTDKPMYMLFLAVLHFFTRNDYSLLQWAQILILALSPVVLYQFGKKFYGSLFGIIVALMLIFQQSNAISLSFKVASVNPKLLMSEELMLLGVLLVTFILFKWMKSPAYPITFLLGSFLGIFSLVRINPIFIIPVIVLIIFIKFRKTPKKIAIQILFLSFGFLLVFLPWLFTGVDSEGKSWFFLKIQDVINTRYKSQSDTIPNNQTTLQYVSISPKVNSTGQNLNFSGIFSLESKASSLADQKEESEPVIWIMTNHFLHNFSTSLLALPDSIKIYNISELSTREYWQDVNSWNGNFSAIQYFRILINLFLLSVGIGFSWRVHRWPGLAPLIVFLAYDLSLSAAMNSGSRYIVPINWIIFFYYAMGLIRTFRFLLALLGIDSSFPLAQFSKTETEESKLPFRFWLPSLLVIAMFALLLPAANLIVPKLVQKDESAVQLLDYAKPREATENLLMTGTIFYPYYQDDGLLVFDFLEGTEINSFSISQNHFTSRNPIVLESEIPALLSLTSNDGESEIESMYILNENIPQLIWHME